MPGWATSRSNPGSRKATLSHKHRGKKKSSDILLTRPNFRLRQAADSLSKFLGSKLFGEHVYYGIHVMSGLNWLAFVRERSRLRCAERRYTSISGRAPTNRDP